MSDDRRPSDVTDEEMYRGITYSSSNPEVATVDANGVVTGKSHGYATITATVTDPAGKLLAHNLINYIPYR